MGSASSKNDNDEQTKRLPRSRSVPTRSITRYPSRSKKNQGEYLNGKATTIVCDDGLTYRRDTNGNIETSAINGNESRSNDDDFGSKKLKRSWSVNSLSRLKSSFRSRTRSLASLNCIARHRPNPKPDKTIQPPSINYFAKLYKNNLHQLVFAHFNFDERLKLRSVCRRWSKDVFTNCKFFRYPTFPEMTRSKHYRSLDKNDRILKNSLAILSSNALAHQCSASMEIVEFTGVFSKNILTKFFHHCFATNITEMRFRFDALSTEIFPKVFWDSFFERFGKNLHAISIEPQSSSTKVNSQITNLLFSYTEISKEYLTSLKSWSLKISSIPTARGFQTCFFDGSLQKQCESLSIEFFYNIDRDVEEEEVFNCLETVADFDNLKMLTLKFVPSSDVFVDDDDEDEFEYDFTELFEQISDISTMLSLRPKVIMNDKHLSEKLSQTQIDEHLEAFANKLELIFDRNL